MANKNKHVIISYFPSAAAAEGDSEALKQWDKANDQIKLGGMGILTAGALFVRSVFRSCLECTRPLVQHLV